MSDADTSPCSDNNVQLGGRASPPPCPSAPGQTKGHLRGPGNQCLHWSDESHGLLAKMWREGVPKPEIAKALSRTVQAIERKATDFGLPRRGPRGRPRKDEVCEDLVKNETEFRRACAESNRLYIEAVEAAGGGSWSGVIMPNAVGSSR